ncbi:MAG: transketolase [Acidobacteria bacterium]|nr:MAG: transketolase [Acidobacteriota bacterium]
MEQPARINKDLIQALETMGNKLRIHSIVATSEAGSGHPTSCMSAADLAAAVFFYAMRYDVPNPKNPVNDRFVLSKGHAAPLLYAAWAEAGAFPVERLKTLRQFTSDLEGHPTPRLPWVEVATGSLGQGLSCGVGMALNGKYLDKIGNNIFVLMGDGEAAEGSVWEAAEIGSFYKLDNLIAIVDVNGLGQSQRTMYGHDTEVYRRRFEAFGWHAIAIDGHNVAEIIAALDEAMAVTDKPSVIVAATKKGKGVSFAEDKDGWHGKAFKKGDELERALAELQPKVGNADGMKMKPPEGRTTSSVTSDTTPVKGKPASSEYVIGQEVATREAYGAALAKLGDVNPLVVGLDGDTKNSTYSEKFMKTHSDRFFELFIAEQNMVGAAVGLSAMGKIPFASTFACFLTRAYDHIRMAAVSQANLNLCGSHAGVSIGEDGPSQMALEDLAMMRAIEGSTVLYPSDAIATEHAVRLSAEHRGISYIRTSRPKTPVIYSADEQFEIGRAKVIKQSGDDKATIVSSGVTLFEALAAYDQLKAEGIAVRVIDLFSVKPVDEETLRSSGGETNNLIITVEDHAAWGGIGDAVASAVSPVGIRVHQLAVREVPRSGKPEELLAAYGIDRTAIVSAVKEVIGA